MPPLKYLSAYPAHLQEQVRRLLAADRLGEYLGNKYAQSHAVRNDSQLYDYAQEMKNRYLRSAPPLAKVVYDSKLQVVKQALGTHTTISRNHGGKLKASREIRIASVFRDAPAPFLEMIAGHELAHMREADHNKAFYALCRHISRDYHQLEFDLRLYLTHLQG